MERRHRPLNKFKNRIEVNWGIRKPKLVRYDFAPDR